MKRGALNRSCGIAACAAMHAIAAQASGATTDAPAPIEWERPRRLYFEVLFGAWPGNAFSLDHHQSGVMSGEGTGVGIIGGGRLGFLVTDRFAVELLAGYFSGRDFSTRAVFATDEHGEPWENLRYEQDVRSSLPLLGLGAAFHFLDKTPITVRFAAGTTIKATLSVANATVPFTSSLDGKTTTSPLGFGVFDANVTVPFLAPELRVGYRWNRAFMTDIGVTFLLFFVPDVDMPPGQTATASLPSGLTRILTLRTTQVVSAFTAFAWLPTIGFHFDP